MDTRGCDRVEARMNAVEEIQAAIKKLTDVKAIGWPCPEWQQSAVRHIARNCEIACYCGDEDHPTWDRYETGPAITLLVSTIDTQLAILRLAITFAEITHNVYTDTCVDLARAINGDIP